MSYIIIFVLFFVSSLQALYYGNPNLPEATESGLFFSQNELIGIKIGYLGDVVLAKSLEAGSSLHLKKMQVFESYNQQGVLTINLMNRFEAFASLGAMKMHLEPRTGFLIKQTLETQDALTWGFGARGVLYSFSKAALGLDFKYQSYHPHLAWGTINGAPFSMNSNAKLSYYEWQIGLGLSYDCGFMTPYFGALYNRAEGKLCNLFYWKEHFSFKSKKKFGAAFGVCFCSKEFFELDLEARVITETAFSAAGNFRF